jgi:post-GPI attachment to proteins factor 3
MAINPRAWLRVTQVGPVQEPASTVFSFLIFLVVVYMARGYRLSWRSGEAALISHLARASVVIWSLTYVMSTLFHTHENVFTERMDYFMPVFAMMSMFVSAVVSVSPWVRHNAAVAVPAIVLPLAAFSLYFMYSMHFVKFDYGWQNKVVGLFLALQLLVWLPWCVANARRHAYVKYFFVGHLCIALGAPFELVDFAPLWQIFDGHSLWHAVGIPGTYFLFSFSVANSNRLIWEAEKQREKV